MQSFKKYLEESHYDWSGRRVPIVRNPTAKRVHAMIKGSKEGHVRWIRHTKTGDVHVWSGDHDYVHDDFVHADYGNHDHYERGYGEDEKDAHYIEHMGRAKFKEKLGLKESNNYNDSGVSAEVHKRLVPAYKHKRSGEIIRGKRGEDHFSIELKNHDDYYHRGFHDHKTNKFYSDKHHAISSPDLMSKVQRMRYYATEETDERIGRVVPAIINMITAKVHKGKRGEDHKEILEKVKRQKGYNYKHWYRPGFHDPKTNKFHQRHEIGDLHATDLMTKTQRMRKYNTENSDKLEQMKKKMGREYLLKLLNK